jgi:hypothetical protein
VASDPHHLTIAFWQGHEERPDVFAMPADIGLFRAGPEWSTLRGSEVGPGATWAWHWALTGIRSRLDRVLRQRALPVAPFGPLGQEAAWAAACDLVDASVVVTGAIAVERLTASLAKVPEEAYHEGPVIFRKGARDHDLRGLRLIVEDAGASGATELRAPIPPADQNLGGGGVIGEFYSDERLVEIATNIYENAIVGYCELVERWMPALRSQLEHLVLMPIRVLGLVNNGRAQQAFGPIPHLAGYLEALPQCSEDEVCMQLSPHSYDYLLGELSYAQQRAARPEAARWLTGAHGGMSFEVGMGYPVSDAVYSWIAGDLKRLGLVGSLAHSRSNEAVVLFDV